VKKHKSIFSNYKLAIKQLQHKKRLLCLLPRNPFGHFKLHFLTQLYIFGDINIFIAFLYFILHFLSFNF